MSFFSFFRKLFGGSQPAAESGGSIVVTRKAGGSAPSGGSLPTNLDRNNSTMLEQLEQAKRYRDIIQEAAAKTNLTPAIICGIGSRESHWGLALKPPGPGGRGDFARRKPRGSRTGWEPNDGGGYGRGLMQIDYDWHEFARTGNWQDARSNVMYACTVLNSARRFFEQRNVPDHLMTRAILAAYNAGATATYGCVENVIADGDLDGIDCKTTGRDYSKDVLNRAGWFQLHGW